jgi:hypothetical protein
MSSEIERMEKAVDRIGEYMHNNLVTVMMGLSEYGLLSDAGKVNAEVMISMSYTDIPAENKERIRAQARELLLNVLKDCVEKEE